MPAAGDTTKARAVFADLAAWRKVAVSGDGVLEWLESVTGTDLSDLAPGRARRASAAAADGRTEAEVTISVTGGSLLLLQPPDAPAIDALLASQAADAGIALEDRSDQLALFAFPQRSTPPDAAGTGFSAPSCLGSGVDVLALAEDRTRLLATFRRRFVQLAHDDVVALRGSG